MFDDKIAVKNERELIFIPLNEITFISSAKNYCEIHTVSGRRYLQRTTMKAIEEQQLRGMLRISRTIIINTKYLVCIHSEEGRFNTAELEDCNEFRISPDRIPLTMAYVEGLFLGGDKAQQAVVQAPVSI